MSHTSGGSFEILAPRSKFYQGPYGRICPNLAPWAPPGDEAAQDQFFLDFANNQMVDAPAGSDSNTPAGYTYFGQFIDHDLTFDPTPLTMRAVDPNGILNFRTPRFDLDCVYGRGPADQPYMFDSANPGKMLIGTIAGTNLRDLPRNSQGRALIGDMRNDENSMVSQLQLAFLLAHNELVDRAQAAGMADPFAAAQKTLRWLYQWLVWNDFITRIAADEVVNCALKLETTCDGRKIWELGIKDVFRWKKQPYMPVEFSGAAYRFGHSMVRNTYETNHPHRGAGNPVQIFDNTGAADPDDLRGFRPMKPSNVIQWDWFFDMTSSSGSFPQKAQKIDTKLADALTKLHEGPAGSPLNVLAFRNLKRGVNLGLPSGPDVADKLCINKVAIDESVEPASLWYYILKEAEKLPSANAGQMLGRLGSVIVCSVFAGILKGNPCSWVNIDPCWTPDDDPLLKPGQDNIDGNKWTVASIIRLSGLPVDAGDVTAQT